MDNSQTLTTQQEKFIIALLSCPGPAEAAEHVGVSRATAYNWLNLPHVKTAYEEAKRDMFAFARERLKQGAALAAETLIDSMQNADRYADKIKAAQIVVGYIPHEPIEDKPTASGIAAELLPYANTEQLAQLASLNAQQEEILEIIRAAKLEQDTGILSIRKKAMG